MKRWNDDIMRATLLVLKDKADAQQKAVEEKSVEKWNEFIEMPFSTLAQLVEEKMDALNIAFHCRATPIRVGAALGAMGLKRGNGIKLVNGRTFIKIAPKDVKPLCAKYLDNLDRDVAL